MLLSTHPRARSGQDDRGERSRHDPPETTWWDRLVGVGVWAGGWSPLEPPLVSGVVTLGDVLPSPDPLGVWTVEAGLELDLPGLAEAAAAATIPVAPTAPAVTHAVSRKRRRRPASRDRGLAALIATSLAGQSGSQLRMAP